MAQNLVPAAGHEGSGDRVRSERPVGGHQVTPAEPAPRGRGGILGAGILGAGSTGTVARHRAACITRVPGQLGPPMTRAVLLT